MDNIGNFKDGDIVYWVTKDYSMYCVAYGIIDFVKSSGYSAKIDLLSFRERRRVNGIPINKFNSETRFKKLPMGWTWDTKLFEITYDKFDWLKDTDLSITNPDNVKKLLNKGILVKVSEVFDGEIKADITREGYRIIKTNPTKAKSKWADVPCHKLYHDYKSAESEAIKLNEEIERQATLTEEEWSIEQIKHNLSYNIVNKKDKIFDFFKNNKNVANIETRIYGGEFQWKYLEDNKWNTIREEDL